MVWDELPTQEKMQRNGYVEGGRCPVCGDHDASEHYLECANVELVNRQEK